MRTISIFSRLLVMLLLLLSYAPHCPSLAVARGQALQDPSLNGAKAAAAKAFKEAQELRAQGSPEALRKAIEKYEEAAFLLRSMGERRNEAAVLFTIGLTYSAIGEQQKAIGSYHQSLPILRAMGDRDREATTLNGIGVIYDSLGEKQKALDYYNQALPILRALGDKSGETATLFRIGDDYNYFGEQQKALDSYNQALLITRELGDHRGEALALHNMASVYDALGERQKALDHYKQALPLWRATGDRPGEAITLLSSGVDYDLLGDKQKALEFYNQALPIMRAVGDRRGEAATLYRIGNLYISLGEQQKALDYYNQALPIQKAAGDRRAEAGTLNNIATAYTILREYQKTLEYYNQALPIRRALKDLRGEISTLDGIGTAYYLLGDKQKALDYYNQVLPIARAIATRSAEAISLTKIGMVYADLGDNQKALEFLSQALVLETASLHWDLKADTSTGLMLLWRGRNSSLAVFNGKQAINALQQTRATLTGLDKESQKSFLKMVEGKYRILADLLIASGRLPEAQEVLNLFKDQQFFDFNHEIRTKPLPLTLTVHEARASQRYEEAAKHVESIGRQSDELARQLNELRLKVGARQPSAEEAARLKHLRAQLKTASDEFLTLIKQVEAEFAEPSVEKDKVSEVADTRELQTVLRELRRQTGQKPVAIYTLVADDNFRTLLVTADIITAASQPIKGDALNQKALQLWGLLQSDKYDPTPLARELYSIVFKPIEAQLPKDTTTILWSLDGSLRYVPMAALHDGKQYLIERYNHVAFTRADSERLLRAVSPRWTGLGLGSSQAHTVELLGDRISFNALPGVTEELRALFRQRGSASGVLDGEVLPDARFTKAEMLAALKQKRPVVHISSHFSFRPGDEARSFLLLGDGTAMTLEEMKQQLDLFAGVELLTLSACNTAAQQAGANGREIDGFAELAQRLGAGSVMATLWPVADNSTPWLMREFYQTRQGGQGLSKSEAFRRAQLALLNGTAQTKPLPAAQKGPSSSVQIVIGGNGGKRDSAGTRTNVVHIAEKDAPAFKRDESKPFAHPYYWAPFILIGNWK